jgi:hypothetical protein
MATVKTFVSLIEAFVEDATSVTLEEIVEVFFSETQGADKAISADELTILVSEVTEHDYSAKSIRANLRKHAYRDQSKMRNATWRVSQEDALAEVKHYLRVA